MTMTQGEAAGLIYCVPAWGRARLRDPFEGREVRWEGGRVRREGGDWEIELGRGERAVGTGT